MIIGIAGKMGSGKSTVAQIISEKCQDQTILPFAKPLKDIAYQMGWNGVKDEKGRRLLQLLGTECGRECIGEDVWVNLWLKEVITACESYEDGTLMVVKNVIADDLRFENEIDAIKRLGGKTIKVKRLTNREESSHASERDLPDSLFDCIINNDGSIDQLKEKVWSILKQC